MYRNFLYLFEKVSLSVVLMKPKFFTVLVGALVQIPPTDSTTYLQIDRQEHRHGKGASIVYPCHNFCGRARFGLSENMSSIVYGRRTDVLLYYGLWGPPYRGMDTMLMVSRWKG